jgi:hypothetical protein
MYRVKTEDEKIVALLHDVVDDRGNVWPMDWLRQVGLTRLEWLTKAISLSELTAAASSCPRYRRS